MFKWGNTSVNKNVDYDVLQTLSKDYMIIVAIDARSGKYNICRCEPQSVKTLDRYISQGLTFEEVVERYVNDHILEEDRAGAIDCFKLGNIYEELRNKDAFSIMVRKIEEDRIRYVRAEVSRFDSNSDRRFLFSVRDVDREVHIERARQNELREAYEAADRASNAKNRFMFNLSHDIRSPLNAIMGYTTVALDNRDDPGMLAKCLGRIDDASHQVLNIMSEILDLNELEEKRITITENTLTVADIEREIVMTARSLTKDKQIDFAVRNLDASNPSIIADNSHLVRAFVNLINHSVRYTETGGSITLTIMSSTSLDPDYRRYTFTLEDTGSGAGSEEAETGVNIPIVRNILDALGGVLKISRNEEGGSSYTIDAEFKLASVGQQEVSGESGISNEEAMRIINGKRILIVDDSQVSSDIAATILGNFSAEVECASDGNTAIDMICSHDVGYYDMVLMDIEMPNMNGIETTREIRGLHRPDAKRLPIVALTANVFEKTRQEAYDSGMNGFVAKPIDVDELRDIMIRNFD